jgi:ubiquinone biosynthesis protein
LSTSRNTYRAILKQVLIDGFFHADPHPGNILVNLDTGNVTFIDTGMVGELDISARMNIGQLMLAVQRGDVMSMAQIMRDLSVPFVAKVDDQAYYKDFERRIGRFVYGGTAPAFNDVVSTAFDLMRQHGLRLDPNLTLAVKSLMQAEAVAVALDPEGRIIGEGVDMIKELVLSSSTVDIAATEVKKQLTMTGRELLRRIPSLSEATLKWVDQYQKGRLEVYVDTSGVSKEVDKFSNLARQIVVGILLAGMIIGSAIATSLLVLGREQPNPLWDLLYRVAYLGYIVSMAIALIIVVRLIWNWLRHSGSG